MPFVLSTLANLQTCACSSLKVMLRRSPGSPSKMMAVLSPRHARSDNLINQVQLNMPHQAPDIKAIDSGDRTGRAAAPALLAMAKHLYVVKAFSEFFMVTHSSFRPSKSFYFKIRISNFETRNKFQTQMVKTKSLRRCIHWKD